MKTPLQWAVASQSGRSKTGSRLLNLYVERLPADSKAPVILYGTPGTARFSLLPTYPILGLHVMDEALYAVTPSKLYAVARNGSYTELGDVDLSGNVSMATNGMSLVMVDGAKGFAYHKEDGLEELEGDGWYPANTVAYQDGYFLFNRAGTGQFFVSELLSTEFDPLKYATAEGAPDDTVAVLCDHREAWLFGEHTVEVWWNSGNPDFPFERRSGAFIEKGIAAPHSAKKMDNAVFWLADDGIVYRANGYTPQRMSSHAMEYDIGRGRLDDAFAYTYIEEGHAFYVITFPTQKKTWCFDVATGEWHERSHIEWGRHHSNCYAFCYDQHLVGDFQNGLIYMLDMAAYSDVGDEIQRVAISPPIGDGVNRFIMHGFELDMDSGVGLPNGQGSDPQAMLQWSDDGQETWSNEHWTTIGKIGRYLTRVNWRRLGMFRRRHMKLTVTDPVPVVIKGAWWEGERVRH